MLELKNVSLSYGDLRVLRDVSLRLAHGKRIAVMGSSGCGKTSLLRVIAGLQSPDSGTVERTVQRGCCLGSPPKKMSGSFCPMRITVMTPPPGSRASA